MYPGQTTALEQYPRSGMNLPQIDAIRRARSEQKRPLYAGSEEIAGGPQSMAVDMEGMMTKPGIDPNGKFGPSGGVKPMQEMGGMNNKRGFEDPRMSQFGRKPMAAQGMKPQRVGAPSGRGIPGVPGPATRIREGM